MMRELALSRALDGRAAFMLAAMGFMLAATALAGLLPLQLSIVAVFLFAGPHNWVEARYFLTRLPARWGRLRSFYLVSLVGIVALTVGFAGLPWLAGGTSRWLATLAIWNTLLVVWLATLMHLRSRCNPRRDWSWAWPAGLLLIALAWRAPLAWDLTLVYLHPLVGLWILDREIRRSRPEYRGAYHVALALLPCCLFFLWSLLADSPDLPGTDVLSVRITQHAGAGIVPRVSTRFLVAAHAFLELLHYGAWLWAIPWCMGGVRWRTERMPLARRSADWKRGVRWFLLGGAGLVIGLWAGFLVNYPVTRDVYFTLALAHVLAEAPALLWSL